MDKNLVATYIIKSVSYDTPTDFPNDDLYQANQYNDNAEFESEGDNLLDFSERTRSVLSK